LSASNVLSTQREVSAAMPQLLHHALRVGVAVPLVMLAIVLLVRLVPALSFGYPLVLLILLAAGPLAAAPAPSVPRGLLAGLLAGGISALGGAAALAIGQHLLGDSRWSFVAPASSPPVPELPRLQLIPFLSWPHHYLLVLQPLTAAGLACAYIGLFGPRARFAATLERLVAALPLPVRAKMIALLLMHAALTVAVGWISFSVIEDLHLRGHMVQWNLHGQEHVVELARALDAEEEALGQWARVDGAAAPLAAGSAREHLAATLDHLRAPAPHPGIWVSRATVSASAAQYEPYLERIAQAHDLLASATDPATARTHLAVARDAVDQLAAVVARDTARLVNETDLTHHSNLFALLGLVLLTVTSGLLLGRVAAQAITRPVGLVAGHLSELASGNFTGRIWTANRDELGALVSKVNEVTAELDRLYQQEQQARAAAEALAARERALATAKEFLAHTIVHDLKQPIAVLAGYVELLESGHCGPLQPRQVEVVRQMMEAARRLATLASDIVDTFRLEQEALPLERTVERPAQLLADAQASVVGPALRAPEMVIAPDLPDVAVDRRLMRRALSNLIANAYQHGGSDAHVRLVVRPAHDGGVLFQIEDNGPGVRPEDRERIFERFVQGAAARAGSGLGLAFVRMVIERHGGRIWVDTSALGGAQFNILLPASTAIREMASVGG
jgi:signal transduction histidine kinase